METELFKKCLRCGADDTFYYQGDFVLVDRNEHPNAMSLPVTPHVCKKCGNIQLEYKLLDFINNQNQ